MRIFRVSIVTIGCLCAFASLGWTQTAHQPGLWEMTSTMTWQKAPLPANMPANVKSPFSTPTTTVMRVCQTLESIAKADSDSEFVAAYTHGHDCQASNLKKTATSRSADLVCTGRLNGKGTLEASWSGNTERGKVSFVGTMQSGTISLPAEYTVEFSSVFKSSDCGDVKPGAISRVK